MNPVIEAAWIATGVGALGIISSTVVAVVSSRTTRKVTAQTLDAARADRLWDARAAAYADTIQIVQHRVLQRGEQTRLLRFDEETEERRAELIDSLKHPDWAAAHARLTAYASQAVIDASKAADDASNSASIFAGYWTGYTDADNATVQEAMQNAKEEFRAAAQKADQLDNALTTLIREELQTVPSREMQSAIKPKRRIPLPARQNTRMNQN